MQATVETLSNLERRMTVSVPMKPIEEEVGQRLGRLARTVKMAGFRPGKVPMSLVQKNYGPQVFDEVISSTVERTFTEAVTENKLRDVSPFHIIGENTSNEYERKSPV